MRDCDVNMVKEAESHAHIYIHRVHAGVVPLDLSLYFGLKGKSLA